jgi:hypothetical protein
MGVGDVVGGLRKEKKRTKRKIKGKVVVVLAVRCGKTKSQQTVDLEFLGEVIKGEFLKNEFVFFLKKNLKRVWQVTLG